MPGDGRDAERGVGTDESRKHKRLRARVRNKYWLLRKWHEALDAYDGPGYAEILDEYRPTGAAPVDVQEIAGLVVVDETDLIHHFRLYRDETVSFIQATTDPDAWVAIDPLDRPPADDSIYLSDGPPPAVTSVLDALDITPLWAEHCADGAHDFYVENPESKYSFVNCRKCDTSRTVLSWLGHTVPYELPE